MWNCCYWAIRGIKVKGGIGPRGSEIKIRQGEWVFRDKNSWKVTIKG